MDTVIEVRNIAKQYHLGENAQMYGSFRESLINTLRAPFKKRADVPRESFWALRDINLDIRKGDVVGLVGSNGAGKSTLLKIMSRITDPSEGEVRIKGRVGSLLEVGTGFHPELTGRENIYLNGAILGMTRTEIDEKFQEIVSFAGIGNFLDTPVKRYSSGMYVRLAFSIAAHVDPEILIVDEVLAVGDVAFQKKCLGKMAEACSRARTVLFVSHNLAAVESLCNRVIVLKQGRMVFDGDPAEGIRYYLRGLESESAHSGSHIVDLTSAPGRPRKYKPQVSRLELYTTDDQPLTGDFPTGGPLKAKIYCTLENPCTSFDACIAFDTTTGQRVCTAHSAYEPDRVHTQQSGEQVFTCEIPNLSLVPGEYKVHIGFDIGGYETDAIDDATRINVIRSDYYGTGIIPTKGLYLLENHWKAEPVREEVFS